MMDNEEGNEGVSQNMTFHGVGAEGIKKLITIVRRGGIFGATIFNYAICEQPHICAYI